MTRKFPENPKRLTPRELDELRQAMAAEENRLGMTLDELLRLGARGMALRQQTPLVRFQAVFLRATTSASAAEIARGLACGRGSIPLWWDLYANGGIEALSGPNQGGRPRNGSGSASRETAPARGKQEQDELVFTSRDAVLAFLQATLQPALPNTPPDFSRTHVLLLGLRGSGKTTLAQQVYPDEAAYFDCEAPEVQRNLRSPQKFLAEVKKRLLVFDEIGQLQDPRGVLNAAVSLADRKEILSVSSRPTVPPKEGGTVYVQNWTEHRVHLLPLTWEEKSLLAREHDFARPLEEALLRPGLPGLSASSEASLETYRHWAQRVFELDLKGACPCDAAQFLRLLEFLVGRSGTWVAPGELAAACGLEGSTARECLEALHAVGMVWCVPRLEEEPPAGWRVYVADPGYVQGLRGPGLAEEARGNHLENLWKHLVLLQLRYSVKQPDNIRCWHSPKRGAVDFVVEVSPGEWAAIQCDWAGRRRLEGIRAFREIYPRGPNLRVLPRVGPLLFAESDSIDPVATPCTTGQVAGFLGEAVNLGERYRTTVLAVAGKSDSGGSGQEE